MHREKCCQQKTDERGPGGKQEAQTQKDENKLRNAQECIEQTQHQNR